jgi:hypothetical protein
VEVTGSSPVKGIVEGECAGVRSLFRKQVGGQPLGFETSAFRDGRAKIMTRIAFIQANEEGKPYSASGAAAARGFAFLGYEMRFFRSDELMDLPLTPMTVVVGGVRTVQNALEKLGARVPFVSAPSSLLPYMGRACWQTTIGRIREAREYPVFVKPYDESKIFNGLVVTSEDELDRLLLPRTGFPTIGEDFPILA